MMLSFVRKWHTVTSPGLRLWSSKKGFFGLQLDVSRWHTVRTSIVFGTTPSSTLVSVTVYADVGLAVWQ
jgi:hypothetical protein